MTKLGQIGPWRLDQCLASLPRLFRFSLAPTSPWSPLLFFVYQVVVEQVAIVFKVAECRWIGCVGSCDNREYARLGP